MSLRLLGACLILALGQGSVHAQTQQTRVAVVVGNNQGRDPARTLRYAEAEAGKLAALLRSAGDFDNVITVKGARREVVEEALAAARAQLNRARAEGKRTLFLFYYSGHGDQEALELGSSRLPLRDLRSYLEQLSGPTCVSHSSMLASRARSPASKVADAHRATRSIWPIPAASRAWRS